MNKHQEPSHGDIQLAEQIMSDCGCSTNNQRLLERITERLAKHRPAPVAEPHKQQEPIAWIERDMNCDDFDPDSVTCQKPDTSVDGWEWVPLYTSPPNVPTARASKPLTDEQRRETISRAWNDYLRGEGDDSFGWYLSQAIEAKLKEKNGY